ncbi:MAG: class I SAM-dependent methyltransferase [Candidatus Aenigmarchaeota archaeon]|nr:class I SAM-dependent methyltransferase [Candidatus Aenigmarchaeota archaeon]
MAKKNIIFWEQLLQDAPLAYLKWFEAERQFLTEHVKKNSSVLEVGCGNGRSLRELLPITTSLTGIDNDVVAVKHAKENFKHYPSVKIIFGEGDDLPFDNESFDVVTCMSTFANFGDKKYQILKEMERVLKRNGHIIISVFSEKALKERMKVYRKLAKEDIKEIRKNGTVIFQDGTSSEQFSKNQLLSIFDKAALRANIVQDAGIAYICKLSKKSVWKGWIIEESLEDKNALLKLKILKSVIERNTEAGQVRVWHLDTVEVDDADIDKVAQQLEKQIKLGYYTHFTDFNTLLIIFKDKSFRIRLIEQPKEAETGATKFKANPEDLHIWKHALDYGINNGKVDQRYIVAVN